MDTEDWSVSPTEAHNHTALQCKDQPIWGAGLLQCTGSQILTLEDDILIRVLSRNSIKCVVLRLARQHSEAAIIALQDAFLSSCKE